MLPFRLDKSNFSPLKKGAIPRLDCRDLFPAKHYTEPLPPTKSALPSPRCNQLFEGAEKSTQDIFLHGAPLPLVWVLVLDNVIPDHAVPFSEAYGGPQFVARALVEGHYCIGKAGTGMPTGALVTYGGRQLTVKRYEVLCFAIEMRWNITQEHEKFQQSSFIVSSAAGRSYNSFRTSQTEVTKSMLLDSEILRVVPDDGMHYATPVEKKFLDHDHQVSGSRTPLSCDRSINKYCGSPLSPISRHVIEDMCSSDMETRMSPKFGKNPSLSIPSARHKGDVASGSFGASQALQEHYCSRGCGCSSLDVEGDQSPKSPATLSPKLFPGMGQVANKIHRSSTTPQSHRSSLADLTINEEDSAAYEESQSRRRTRPLVAVPPARLTSSQRVETALEQRSDGSRPHNAPVATSPRINSSLSPIVHLSLLEPFNDSTPAGGSPKRPARSIVHGIRPIHQDIENGVYPSRLTPARISSPLTGGHQSRRLSLSGASNLRPSLRAEHTGDNSSFSGTEIGPLYRSTRATMVAPPLAAQQIRTERTLDATTQARVGASSHERRPHIRPALQDSSVQMPLIRASSPRTTRQSPANMGREVDDCEVSPTTFGVDRNRMTLESGGPRAQGSSNAVITDLRRSVVAEPSAKLSPRSPYWSKGDRSAHLQTSSPRAAVSPIGLSPYINHREFPEPSRIQITPLKVSAEARHSQLSPYEALSGKREWSSSTTHAISSSPGTPGVFPAVAPSCTDGSPVAAQGSPHIQITPLEVSVEARRSQLSPYEALSGKREWSSSTHRAISSSPGTAAVLPAVASSYADDSPVAAQEYPRIQITPLEVSAEARRSRLSPYDALSGKREWSSSTTHAISSSLGTAAVLSAVPSSYTDDSPVAVQESPRIQITPLEVSVEARLSRLSSNSALSGKRELSSSTIHTTSSPQATAVVATVAPSCADDSPVASPSRFVVDSDEGDRATTRSLAYARTMGDTKVQERQPVGPTVVAGARPGVHDRLEYVELDEQVSEKTQPDVTVQGSWALKTKGRDRASSPVGPGPRPSMVVYRVGHDDTRGKGRDYVSTQGADVHEIGKSAIQSSHSDMIQIQPSQADDVLNDASISRPAYQESSYPGKGTLGYFSSPYEDTQDTDATMERVGVHSQAYDKTKPSDSFDRTHEAREKHCVERKSVPPGFDKLSQNTKDTESSVEASRKAVASTVYETIPVHVPSDAGYHLGKRENENFRPGGAADVNPRWHDTTHKTKSSTRQRYQVPLSKYLEPESDATGPLVTSRERKEDGLRQKGHETGAHHRNATEDSESIRVTRKFEEQEMVTNTASYNDVSKSTSPKQSSSVVSALLATACVAAVAFEAAAESRQKQGSQHTKVKRDESCDKVAHDRDSPVRTAPARIIEDNKTVTNEKNVAVNRTAQQTAVIDSLLKTVTTPTPAAVTLNKAQNEIRQSGSVDVHSPRYEMRENQKRVDYADSHPAVSAEGVRKSVRTTESTDRSVVAETRGAVSEQPTPLIKGRNIENVYSNQRTQTRVDSGRTVQASERAREETDVRDQATHTTQRATPRGQNTDTFKVEGGSTQHTSFDAIGVAARTSDKSAECSTRSEEQAIQEYKTAAPKCEVDQSLAQPSWTPALQEHTAVVVSPQVSVNVQQTVIVKNVDISQSTRLAAENQQGKQAETIARRSGGDSLSRDTERGSPSRSRSGSLQDDESTHLVESSRVESGQSSPKAVASGPSNLSSRSAAADARPFTEKTIPIPRQPAPTPIASRKQSGVTSSDTRSSIHSERGAGSHDGRSSTSRPNDVGHKGNHTERVENVEQTIHLQPRTQILGDADSDTTRCTLPSVEENSVVSSSRRSETSTETQSLGRSDRVPANERQLDRVSDVRNSSTVGFDDTTIVQKSAPSVRSGRVDQRTTPRRATTGDSSRSHVLPEKSRSMTQYSVGVEVDRTDVVRRSTVIETPLQEVNEVQEDVNDLHGYTGVSTLKAQTNSDATRSTEVSIDRTSTYSRSSETCIAENLSTQKSEKQARAERVDSKVDVQDTCEVQKLELTTYPRSLREASHRDSAQSIDKTSHSLAWSDRQTGRTDEKTSRQDEAMLTVGVTIGLIAVKEQHEVSVESPRIPLLTGNTSTSSPVTTDGTAGPSSEIKHDQPPEGVVRVPIDGNVARTRNPSPSGSNSAFSQSDTHLMLQRNDTGLVDRRADSVVSSVTAESHPQTKEMPGARRNTTVIPAASSEQCSEAAEHIQIALDGKETRAPLSNTSYESVKLSYKLDVEEDHEHLDGDIDGDEESERMQAEAEIQLSREHSPAQMTSEKAFMQSDAHMILQLDDARLVDKHADSVVLSAIAESHAQTKEMHGARRNTTVDLAASSEQRSEAAKRIQIALDDEETRVPLTRTSDETIKLSCKSDVEMHHGHVNEDIDSERTADTSLSASHLTSTRDDESRVKSITESRGILHPLARGQSLDLAIVKQSKEDLLSGSQVHTSSVLEPGLATTDENTTFAQGIEDDVVRLSTSLEVSATTAGTSLTTSAHPAEATADRSNDDDSTSIATKKSGISSVVSTPHSSPRSSTSLASVPASDRQTTLSAAQITGCVVESASAVVVGAAGVQLSKEFICGDTSSTKVIQQQTISGSKELTARTQEKYDIHEQATSSEYETISFNGYSDCYTSSRDNDKTAIQPTRTPRQNSIECEQQVAQLVQPTSQQRKSAQMQGVSNVGLESRSKSMSKERLRTENTEMAKLSTTTTSEPSPRQTVKGVAGSLHLDIESHSTESIRSSRRSVDGDDSPSDLQQPLSVDGKFPAQSPHDSHSSLSESRPISRAEIIGNVSRSFLHSPGNLSPAILYASPIDFSGSEAGTAASPIDEIHGTVAEEDDVEFEEERASASPVHTNNSSMVPIKGGEPRTRSDVHPDQRVAYSPASSLSPSPLTSAVGGEASIGKPADHIGENNDSGGQFTVPASSSLAQEERTQSALEVNSDHEWQINIQWIPDNKEPPPSYEDAVSDYDNSPIGPSDALSGDDRQSMRQYTQYYGDDKSSTLNVTSDEFQRRSEEGASALEWHWNPQATCPKNDSDVGESVPLPVEAEDALRTHQEIMNEGVSWASETDEERVLDQHIGVVPRECANTVHESSSQFFTDTRSANRFHPAANGSPSSQLHSSDATSAHDDVDAPSSYEVRREVLSSERSTSQEYVCVVRSDEDSKSLAKVETHSSTKRPTEVVDTFHVDTMAARKDSTEDGTGVHSHSFVSIQETVDNNLHTSTFDSDPIACITDMDEHEIETLQRQLRLSSVDLYDIAECGALDRCLSRPLSIRTRSMERWTSLSGDTEQGPMEGSDGQLEGAGSVLVHYRSVSVFALAKMAWRVDVLGTSRWVSTVRGWGDFTFVRNVSLANRAAHVIDHRLFANDRPGTIVRTGLSTTEHRPIVIVIASVTGRPFDYDALVACILSCIDLDLGTPQHLGLLCAIPRKAKEMVVTLNDTLHLIIDILEYHGLEVGNVSVDELDVGYWVQMTVFLRVQLEDQVPDVFVADREQYEQGVSVPLDANPHASAEGLV